MKDVMKISKVGIELIKEFEGYRAKAYLPTPNDVWTIGYGHTASVQEFDVVDSGEAEGMLRRDLEWVENVIRWYIVVDLNQNQYDALCSFVYNLGGPNLRHSTLIKKLNRGNYADAALEILKWDKQAGEALTGLTRRRRAEYNLFKTPVSMTLTKRLKTYMGRDI